MAGTINVDTLKADSNLRLQIASANVAFIDANGLTIVGNSLNVGGGRISVTSNSAIINPTITTPTVSGNLSLDATGTTGVRSPEANTLTFHTAGTEDMRINSVGGVQFNGSISVGGATPTTSGAGITFPATQSASTDANTLDDYEEGTWTPTLGGTATYSAQAGTYVKVGRLVYARGTLTVNSIGSGASLNAVSGLPFTLNSVTINGGAFASFGYWASLASSVVALYGSADGGSTTLYFGSKSTAGTTIDWTTNVWGNGARIDFNLTYYANA